MLSLTNLTAPSEYTEDMRPYQTATAPCIYTCSRAGACKQNSDVSFLIITTKPYSLGELMHMCGFELSYERKYQHIAPKALRVAVSFSVEAMRLAQLYAKVKVYLRTTG